MLSSAFCCISHLCCFLGDQLASLHSVRTNLYLWLQPAISYIHELCQGGPAKEMHLYKSIHPTRKFQRILTVLRIEYNFCVMKSGTSFVSSTAISLEPRMQMAHSRQTVSDRVYFLGLQITVDGDCSHVNKRCLLLGRKAMTNLGCLLKSRDITLQTNVCIVKATVFPVVMNGYKNWTVKKVEWQRTGAFKLWCWRRLLSVPWTGRRLNQSILMEINPEYSLEGLMLKLQYFGHLMQRADSLQKTLMLGKTEGRRSRG